jgi:hypothetical protein
MDLMKRWARLLAAVASCTVMASAGAAPLLSEGFDNIAALPASGWVLQNNSSPPGTTSWFQGDPALFAAPSGPANSYIAANFNNAAYGGRVSNWLITPELALNNGESMNFALRLLGEGFLDRVEVYLSTSGASTDVGSSASSTGAFTFLAAFDSTVDTGWVGRSVLVNGLTAPASGRFAFRYVVDDTSANGDYIGIDAVSVNAAAIPEPGVMALVLLGSCAMVGVRRRLRPRHWLAISGLSAASLAAAAPAPDNGVMSFPNVSVVAQPAAATAGQQGGFKAYKDPVTGKLGSPTPAQAAALNAAIQAAKPASKARVAAPAMIHPRQGGIGALRDKPYSSYAVASKEAGGVTEQCVPGEKAALAALQGERK